MILYNISLPTDLVKVGGRRDFAIMLFLKNKIKMEWDSQITDLLSRNSIMRSKAEGHKPSREFCFWNRKLQKRLYPWSGVNNFCNIVGWGKYLRGAIINKWGNSVLGIISQNILKIINFFFFHIMWIKS